MTRTSEVAVFYPGLDGGIGTAVHALYRDGWTPRGLSPILIATRSPGSQLRMWRSFAVVLSQLLLDLSRGRFAFAHLNVSVRGSTYRKLMIAWMLRRAGVPYVIQLHSGDYVPFYSTSSTLMKRWIRTFFGSANRVLILDEGCRSMVETELDVAPDCIALVSNGVPDPAPTRGSATASSRSVRIVFVGRLTVEKGLHDLIAALSTPQLATVEWRLTLVGPGDVELVRSMAAAGGIGDHVEVLGQISHDSVAEVLATSDIYAAPSHFEAMSMALIEAMAHGLACISTHVGAHGRLMEDGIAGILVDVGDRSALADALLRLIDEPSSRQSLGEQARRTFLDEYELETVRHRYEAAFDLSGRNGDPEVFSGGRDQS